MLKKSLFIRLDSTSSPELFFPRRERASEIEDQSETGPDHRCKMNPEKPGPDENQHAAEYNEHHVRDMERRNRACKRPPDHVVAVGSNIGFSMIPTMFPKGSFTEPTLIPSPTS